MFHDWLLINTVFRTGYVPYSSIYGFQQIGRLGDLLLYRGLISTFGEFWPVFDDVSLVSNMHEVVCEYFGELV